MRINQQVISWLSRITTLVVLIGISPLLIFISAIVLFTAGWPVFFIQERVGKGGRTFLMYKFRTMRVGAEKEQDKYRNLNEADGPVFKIRNDPRLTKIGKFLSRSGLDELPQLVNILKGEMALVGPRPLPTKEAARIKDSHKDREIVLPGVISPWVVNGHHKMGFEEWMKSDIEYARNKNLKNDIILIIKGAIMLFRLTLNEIKNILPSRPHGRWILEKQA